MVLSLIKGMPVIFLHGGPGSGCSDSQKALFNSSKFRVIFLDQRGSGKSKPLRHLVDNNTQLLIEDIEAIRTFLNIKKWLVVGGSWGATLAIAYAEKFPKVIEGIVIRSLFLGTRREVDWAFFQAAKIFKPNLLMQINRAIKNNIIINPIYKLGKMLESKDLETYGLAAKLWLEYEGSLASINSNDNVFEYLNKNRKRKLNLESLPNTPFLEWHYIKNNFFFKEEELFKNRKVLRNVPIRIIQPTYDLLCPPSTSYKFIVGLENTKIYYISAAGHYLSDPGIKERLSKVINEFNS